MDIIRGLWIALVVSAPFWFMGFWLQRLGNADRAPGYGVEARGWWAWLFGVQPGGGGRVYLGPSLFQACALLYLIIGFLAVWICDIKILGKITTSFVFVELLIGVLEGLFVKIIRGV